MKFALKIKTWLKTASLLLIGSFFVAKAHSTDFEAVDLDKAELQSDLIRPDSSIC